MASGDTVYQATGVKAADVDHTDSGSVETARITLPSTLPQYAYGAQQTVTAQFGSTPLLLFVDAGAGSVPSQLLDPTKTYDIIIKEH